MSVATTLRARMLRGAGPPEDSVAMRVVVAGAVEVAILAVVAQGGVSGAAAILPLVMAPAGYVFSYRQRHRSNITTKVLLSVGLLAAFAASLAARVATAHDEGEPVEPLPNRLIEENFWRAIRYGLSGELLDFARGKPIPARQRLEELMEWVAPAAQAIGALPYLALPERNAAERQIERFEEGATLEQIYAEQVRTTEHIGGR